MYLFDVLCDPPPCPPLKKGAHNEAASHESEHPAFSLATCRTLFRGLLQSFVTSPTQATLRATARDLEIVAGRNLISATKLTKASDGLPAPLKRDLGPPDRARAVAVRAADWPLLLVIIISHEKIEKLSSSGLCLPGLADVMPRSSP